MADQATAQTQHPASQGRTILPGSDIDLNLLLPVYQNVLGEGQRQEEETEDHPLVCF